MGNINAISLGTRGCVDDAIWTNGRIYVTGNPPEDVIGYGVCYEPTKTIDACIQTTFSVNACVQTSATIEAPIYIQHELKACINTLLNFESLKIIKKFRYYS